MDGLLKVSSTRRFSQQHEDALVPAKQAQDEEAERQTTTQVESAEDVLKLLQSKPDFGSLIIGLRWLNKSSKATSGAFNIKIPSNKAAEILNALVNTILPDYWQLLRPTKEDNHAKQRRIFTKCLTNIAGIGALTARSKNIVAAGKVKGKPDISGGNDLKTPSKDVLEVLEEVLQGPKTILLIVEDLCKSIEKPMQRNLAVRELVSLVGSGRLISVVAEAESMGTEKPLGESSWIGDGKAYTQWLGRNLRELTTSRDHVPEIKQSRDQIFRKGLSLGYRDQFIEAIYESTIHGDADALPRDTGFFSELPYYEQKIVLFALLRLMPTTHNNDKGKATVRGIAALAQRLTVNPKTREMLVDWLVDANSGSVNLDLIIHRAVMTVIAEDVDILERAASKLLAVFLDKMFIEHSPIFNQEVQSQDLLLAIGQLYRVDQSRLRSLSHSSAYINAISNRLAASSPRAQFLGMVVGTAVSELVDEPDKRMKLGIDDIESEDGMWYRGIVKITDSVGTLEDLRNAWKLGQKKPKGVQTTKALPMHPRKKPTQPQTSKIVAIEELEDSESEDDDLPLYEKPDSDREDSDEDPTLITRNKPTAPVYIRDLILGLRDSENYDRHKLAIYSASDLIRRKANFGTEVTEHVEELASQLTGLKDTFNLDLFEEKRLQAMISVIVAQPLPMGKWFSTMLFNADYSMSQRASMLTALSLAARDLAGYRSEDASLTGAHTEPKDLFPSKRLHPRMDPAFAQGISTLNAIAAHSERAMIKPLAAAAADQATGPNILKIRTFSSRMEVEKNRKRPITNALAKVVADGFFFPLTGRYRAHASVYGDRSPFAMPFLLAHFLKSLALIMSASGASTLSLPALTAEFWGFLLPLRVEAGRAKVVLEALLFCLLTVLEINVGDLRRVAEDHAQELLETRGWAQRVFDGARGGEKEGEKIRMLAASVLVKCSEVVEKYQSLLLGDLVNYM
ncbi:MAG: telomere binding protein [Stictis urceolatum]|nr:telomere binding protein [Stictis urceolata]